MPPVGGDQRAGVSAQAGHGPPHPRLTVQLGEQDVLDVVVQAVVKPVEDVKERVDVHVFHTGQPPFDFKALPGMLFITLSSRNSNPTDAPRFLRTVLFISTRRALIQKLCAGFGCQPALVRRVYQARRVKVFPLAMIW